MGNKNEGEKRTVVPFEEFRERRINQDFLRNLKELSSPIKQPEPKEPDGPGDGAA